MTTQTMLRKLADSKDIVTKSEALNIIGGGKPTIENKRELFRHVLKGESAEALMIAEMEDFVALMRRR